MRKRPEEVPATGGRPLSYTKEKGDEVCRLVSTGLSLRRACREMNGEPSPDTVRHWLSVLPEAHPFHGQFARACATRADSLVDELTDIADRTDALTVREGGGKALSPLAARIMIEARVKYAQLTSPRKYGTKVDVTSGGEQVKPAAVGAVIMIPDNGRDRRQ